MPRYPYPSINTIKYKPISKQQRDTSFRIKKYLFIIFIFSIKNILPLYYLLKILLSIKMVTPHNKEKNINTPRIISQADVFPLIAFAFAENSEVSS